MKINADYREFKTVDEIAMDLIWTLSEWQPQKLNTALEFINSYINDYYYDYALTDEEFDEIEKIITDWFTEED